MARYIDADELLAELQEEIDFKTSMYTEEQNYYFTAGLRCAYRDVKNQPTADVIPKSEVEKLRFNLEAVLEEIPETKREVAREIFELIDCAFSPVLVYNGYTIKEYLAELKKKYTEVEHNG